MPPAKPTQKAPLPSTNPTQKAPLPRKNAITELTIDDVDSNGFGIGRANGFAIFVEGGLPGDRLRVRLLKVKPHYAYGKLEKIITPSPHRQPSACPVAARCGGCQWQHSHYPAQLLFKRRMVADALTRIGKIADPPVLDVIGMDDPYHYRNKAQFPVGEGIGFYAPRTHRIVPVTHCNIQHPSHEAVLSVMRDYIARCAVEPYNEATHTGLLRHIVMKAADHPRALMVALVINGKKLPQEKALAAQLTAIGATTVGINIHTEKTNVVLGPHSRWLTGDGFIHDQIGTVMYRLSLRSFFQVNPVQTRVLYDTVLRFGGFTGHETVIDAHAGVGGIALYIAAHVKQVYGIETVPESVADATHNAALNGITHAHFLCGPAETVLPDLLNGKWAKASEIEGPEAPEPVRPEAVILDPPRKGCEKALLDALPAARIPTVLYVSCDPATLARDIRLLTESGYALAKVQPVDMFPMTGKVEAVALLTWRG